MESHLSEESLWASGLASRLRVLQTTLADDAPATRREFIAQEIERSLQGCVPEKRRALLRALTQHFPANGGQAGPAAPAPIPMPAGAPETPEQLLARAAELLPSLPENLRADFLARLKDLGLLPESQDAQFKMAPDLQKRLGLEADESFGAERVARTLAVLLDMVLTLDQLSWTLWRQMAPRSAIRKEGDFSRLTGEFLRGSNEVSPAQIMQALEKTRKLIAGLLGAIGRAPGVYAHQWAAIFDAEKISVAAQPEKKMMESIEYASWRKYNQLQREYGSESAMEKGIQDAMAKAAENLMLGRAVG